MPRAPVVSVEGLDHVVLNVADMARSVAWYREVLGMEPERLEEWERGEAPFVSMRIDAATLIDLQLRERSGENADHLALVVSRWFDLDAIAVNPRVDCLGPPRDLWGAQGWGVGIYLKDPDGNTVELRQYPQAGQTRESLR